MLTPYGKLVRKHRIDEGMTLREMAQALSVTPAFVSATETGKRPVPKDMVAKIIELFHLDIAQRAELQRALDTSRTEVRVRLGSKSTDGDREVAAMFARRFPELSEEGKEEIRRILEERGK